MIPMSYRNSNYFFKLCTFCQSGDILISSLDDIHFQTRKSGDSLCRVACENANGDAELDEGWDQMSANLAGGAEDEDGV